MSSGIEQIEVYGVDKSYLELLVLRPIIKPVAIQSRDRKEVREIKREGGRYATHRVLLRIADARSNLIQMALYTGNVHCTPEPLRV